MATIYQRLTELAATSRRSRVTTTAGLKARPPRATDNVNLPPGNGLTVPSFTNIQVPGTTNGSRLGNDFKPQPESYNAATADKAALSLQQQLAEEEKRRQRGRTSTILTGATGLLSEPALARRTLLGA